MKRKALLRRLLQGSLQNVSFQDAVHLIEGFGFVLSRVRGSHHIFVHPDVPRPLNFQESGGQAQPYQLRQLLRQVERYNLSLEVEES